MSKLSKIRSQLTIDNIIFVLLISILLSYFLIQTVYLKTEIPQVGVTTTSMTPTYPGFDLRKTSSGDYDILRGDLLIIQEKRPEIGDTIVFEVDNLEIPVVHRIILEKQENGSRWFGTKGDANPLTDVLNYNGFGWVEESRVLGVVVFSVHNVGWLTLELQKDLLKNVLILIVILLAISYISDYFKRQKNEKNNLKKKMIYKEVKVKIRFFSLNIKKRKTFSVLFLTSIIFIPIIFGVYDYIKIENSVNIGIENNIEISGANAEKIDNGTHNIYAYNVKLTVKSSGVLNSINRIEITAQYDGYSSNFNPTYIWNIVYDFSGPKEIIVPILMVEIFNSTINTNLTTKIYATGFLASGVTTMSQEMIISFVSV